MDAEDEIDECSDIRNVDASVVVDVAILQVRHGHDCKAFHILSISCEALATVRVARGKISIGLGGNKVTT